MYLFDIVPSLCTGLNEHHIQLFGSLFPFLCGDLPGKGGKGRHKEQEEELEMALSELLLPLQEGTAHLRTLKAAPPSSLE